MNEAESSYEVYLVNDTDTPYNRVFALTGAYCGDDDGLIETSKMTKEKGALAPHSSLLLEKGNMDELEFVIWYHLDLYEDGAPKPTTFWFDLPKYYGWITANMNQHLPVLGKNGMMVELVGRKDTETIEDEIKHINMSGGYHKSSGA